MMRASRRPLTEGEKLRFLLDARERRIRELKVALRAKNTLNARLKRRELTIAMLEDRIGRPQSRIECASELLRAVALAIPGTPTAKAIDIFLEGAA